MIYKLPDLPYDYGDLEPYIDAETMEIHHTKHHQAYIDKLNEALADYPDLREKPLEELLEDPQSLPGDIAITVRNNGGGTLNHGLFWHYMSPNGGGEPKGKLARALEKVFGSYGGFKDEFSAAARDRFGSGWAWLVLNPAGNLEVISMPNQDNPVSLGSHPIVGLDVWEHAYYLKYHQRRVDYIAAWWHIVNWPEIENHFERIT